MVSRAKLTGVISVLLLASCGAWAQVEHSSGHASEASCFSLSGATRSRCQSRSLMSSFPEAPALHVSTDAYNFNSFLANTSSKLSFSSPAVLESAGDDFYGLASSRDYSVAFLDKYLVWSLRKNSTYQASRNGSILGRAIDAAPQLMITRDSDGRRVLNTSYLLRALTFAAVDTAHRPSWAQSSAGTFSDFGSSVGSDAGMNVFHEFQSNILHIFDSHSPKFVKRLEGLTRY